MSEPKMFPIQDGPNILWSDAELCYDVYSTLFGKDQSLERLGERAGFGMEEVRLYWWIHTRAEGNVLRYKYYYHERGRLMS